MQLNNINVPLVLQRIPIAIKPSGTKGFQAYNDLSPLARCQIYQDSNSQNYFNTTIVCTLFCFLIKNNSFLCEAV